jgi:hypothetical protein
MRKVEFGMGDEVKRRWEGGRLKAQRGKIKARGCGAFYMTG